jgi:hypothetical protein
MKQKTPPTPAEIDKLALDIRRLCMVIRTEFEWVYRATYSRRVGESAHVQVSDPNDSTSSAALGEQRVKRNLMRVGEELERTFDKMRGMEYALAHMLEAFEPKPRPEPLRYPRTESRQDLVEHAEAQERREQRGASYGEG